MCRIRSNLFIATINLLLAIKNADTTVQNVTMAIDTNVSIYYDPIAKEAFPIELMDSSRIPANPIKYISHGLPCSCSHLKCGCCTGLNITMINFDRLACTNITLVPEEFALDFHVFMDDDIVMSSTLTARNPPAFCVPFYFVPTISFCVRFFDLHFNENKFNFCVDFETRIGQWTIFIMHFNCLSSDGHGVAWMTPSSTGIASAPTDNAESEIYDVVNFEIADDDPHYLHTSTLTPEEEDQIGTLKL